MHDCTDEGQWTQIEKWGDSTATETFNEAKNRQKEKYEQLNERYQSRSLDTKRVVKNISNKTLTQDE